ncbi:MAG: hypothetical protein CVU64_07300 [Deltaproteobacteria bacterium HGW-Deltaproteobacteria-21]|nr:MAG: hypothetical protein CVU64_07300 [Deltaproteobacteria bacterium HGW-Deltaproteobacteria-21]
MLRISDLGEIEEFDRRIREVLGPDSLPEYTVEPIPSGVPILLLFERGALSTVFTKGARVGGQDVTRNVKTILSVPLSLHSLLAGKEPPARLEVWGTVYAERNAVKADIGYESMRDMVSASLIGADMRDAARFPLDMFCHGAEQEIELSRYIGAASHFEVMLMLQDWGFRVNKPHIRLCSGITEVIQAIRTVEEQKESSYELDEAVVQLNLLAQRSAVEAASDLKGVIEYEIKPPQRG